MIAIPTVDLRGGACVRPAGSTAADGLAADDARTLARLWALEGFRYLQVVDLDGGGLCPVNAGVIEDIVRDGALAIQAGGDVQSIEQVERLVDTGATRVILGSRALSEPDWAFELAEQFPGCLVIPTELRERRVVTRGWIRDVPLDIHDFVDALHGAPLGGVLVASARDDAPHAASDLATLEELVETSSFPIMAAGGARTMDDLRALEHRGVSAVVLGSVLYSGALEPRAVAAEFSC